MNTVRRSLHAGCVAFTVIAAGCGGGSSPTAPTPPAPPAPVPTTTVAYSGLFASGLFTGTVNLTAVVAASSALTAAQDAPLGTATGTAKFTGASTTTINLTGTYDAATKRFTLSGTGWAVDATVVDGRASGTISTPVGAGGVAALMTTESNPAARYCGSYSGTESGKFLVVTTNGLASGVAAQDGMPGGVTLAGSASGNNVSLSWSWTEGSGGQGVATGKVNGQSISGSWSNTDGQSGTWSGKGC